MRQFMPVLLGFAAVLSTSIEPASAAFDASKMDYAKIGAKPVVVARGLTGCVYPKSEDGVDPDGVRDSQPALQKGIDRAAELRRAGNTGVRFCVAAGTYLLRSGIVVPAGSKVIMDSDAVIVRGFEGGSGNGGALFRSDSFTEKTNSVSFNGGAITYKLPGSIESANGGRIFSWYGDNWKITNVTVRDWGGRDVDGKEKIGRAISYVGDNVLIANNSFLEVNCGAGCAAIMVTGGAHHQILNNAIVAGDDCIGIVPNGYSKDPLFNKPIRDALAVNNTCVSKDARTFIVGLHLSPIAEEGDPPLDTTVEDVVIRNFDGVAESRRFEVDAKDRVVAALILNRTQTGEVRNVRMDNVRIDNTNLMPQGLKIVRDSTGDLDGVTLVNSSYVGECLEEALLVQNATNVTIDRSTIVASSGCRFAARVVDAPGFRSIQSVYVGETSPF